jgi:hypothetical protein
VQIIGRVMEVPSTAAAATGSGITHLGWRERLCAQLGRGSRDGGIAVGPVAAAAGEQAHGL